MVYIIEGGCEKFFMNLFVLNRGIGFENEILVDIDSIVFYIVYGRKVFILKLD